MGEGILQADAEFVQFHRDDADQGAGKEAFQNIDGRCLDVGPSALVFDGDIEDRHDHTGGKQRSAEQRKQPDRCLYPVQLEDVSAHVAHHSKEVGYGVIDRFVEPLQHGVPDHIGDLLAKCLKGTPDGIADAGKNIP